MANELHIEREGGISLDEWKKAVGSVPGIRLDSSPIEVNNPRTGAQISIGGRDGDAAVKVKGKWVKVFGFFEGSASFKSGPGDLDDPRDPITRAVFSLARLLSAKVVGVDGEEREEPSDED